MKTIIHLRKEICSKQFLVLLFLFFTGMLAQGQMDQRLAMAEKYFAAGEYFTAADLYDQYLHPSKKETVQAGFPLNSRRYGQGNIAVNKMDVLFKQAESYRLANYWPEAAEKYKECFDKDAANYPASFYWYAVCQRSIGKYDVAEEYIKKFLAFDNTGKFRHEADEELQTIFFIKKQLTRPDTVLYSIKKNNTSFSKEKGIFGMTGTGGGQFLFTSTVSAPAISQDENPNQSRLFFGSMKQGVLENNEPVIFSGSDENYNQGAATISADKKTIYYTQWKMVNGKKVSAIYASSKEGNGWGTPVLLSAINKNGSSSKQPYCSADGKKIFFSSDMPGGSGGFDIWYVTVQDDGMFSEPVNAGNINTAGDEQAPFFHYTSGTLVFSSNHLQGMGGFDLFTSKLNGSSFTKPENLGHPVNSSRDDIYFYAAEGEDLLKEAIIGSDRGSSCCMEIYTVKKLPKKKMITGIILDCKTNTVLAGAEVFLKDMTGKDYKTIAGPDGRFSFELSSEINQHTFHVTYEKYKDKTTGVSVTGVDESDWQKDILNNEAICLEKNIKEEKKLVIKAENVVTLYYDFDKSLIRDREKRILDSVFTVLDNNKSYTIQISGYTDGFGTNEYNDKLSNRRAKAAADYLVKKGIETSRISFVSFGECCPAEMEIINGRDNPDGRSKNRRALINISKEE